jgi:hypothetical protein
VIRAEAATPIDDWLRTGVVTATEPDLLVHVTDLPLEHVPWTCTRAAGLVTAEILLEDVLGNAPSIEGSVQMRELRIVSEEEPGLRGTHPYEMRAALRVQSAIETHLEGCAIIAAQGELSTQLSECGSPTLLPQDSEVVVSAAVPIRWVPGTPIPELLLDRALDFAMLMSEAHLEPLLALVPQITEADVIADGRLFAHGPWDALETTGGLAMRDGHVRIVGLGQQLTDIGGAVQLHGTRIVIGRDDALHARDGDGTIDVWGEIGMRGLLPTSANVTMAPDEFPVRRESAVLATLSGRAEAGITIGLDGVEGAIHVERLTVRLPEQAAGSVQPLDPHPEVALVGSDAPELALEDGPGYPIHLRVDAHTPFWVRRNDFAVQGTAELDVTYLDPNLYVGGYATLGRGYFEVFGKRFLVQRGSLVFTGDTELNPLVDLVATYELPGRAGATISVIANGRLLDDLQIEFTSTETSDQGEIIALLVSGRRSIGAGDPQASQQAATEQAASFLAGISAGILTLGLRQQFGDIVPMIAIEAGSNLGETRTRAGFNVDALIPDFLRGAVLGAYLEGFVTTGTGQQAGGGGGGVGGGVALELQFPEDVIGSGTYVPPMSFGIDFLWEPSQSRCETADDGTTTCTR